MQNKWSISDESVSNSIFLLRSPVIHNRFRQKTVYLYRGTRVVYRLVRNPTGRYGLLCLERTLSHMTNETKHAITLPFALRCPVRYVVENYGARFANQTISTRYSFHVDFSREKN